MESIISLIVRSAYAQSITLLPTDNAGLVEKIQKGNIELSDIPLFILYFIEIAVAAAGIVAFLMILYGGYQYVIGGVYSEMKEKGKTTLTQAIVGFVIALLSYAIVNLIQIAATSAF
jgi:hypothetical protein